MREYHHTGKYGQTAQGKPVRARQPGRCHLCDKRYPAGERVIYLPGVNAGSHPSCVFKDE